MLPFPASELKDIRKQSCDRIARVIKMYLHTKIMLNICSNRQGCRLAWIRLSKISIENGVNPSFESAARSLPSTHFLLSSTSVSLSSCSMLQWLLNKARSSSCCAACGKENWIGCDSHATSVTSTCRCYKANLLKCPPCQASSRLAWSFET